jgi:cytochrome P450
LTQQRQDDSDIRAALVSRHEDVRAVALDTEHFSSRRSVAIREGRPPARPAPPVTSDPPVHSAQKKLLLPAFTPDAIRRYEPQTRAIYRESPASSTQLREVAGGAWEHAALRLSYFELYSAVT